MLIVTHAIEDLSTTTIFMMIFGLARRRRPCRGARGLRAHTCDPQVLLSFGGGALAAYVYDEDRKKDK